MKNQSIKTNNLNKLNISSSSWEISACVNVLLNEFSVSAEDTQLVGLRSHGQCRNNYEELTYWLCTYIQDNTRVITTTEEFEELLKTLLYDLLDWQQRFSVPL